MVLISLFYVLKNKVKNKCHFIGTEALTPLFDAYYSALKPGYRSCEVRSTLLSIVSKRI
jgi:hypothetical protein